MIGIYQDDFIDYLKDNLGVNPKITSKNIIVSCPWCEYQQEKDHYHLYISFEAPIFHCFHAGCEKGGILSKLIEKISGHDIDGFIDKEKVKEYEKLQTVFSEDRYSLNNIKLPIINSQMFPLKKFYIQKRLKFSIIDIHFIKGLIFDIHEFLNMNNIPIDETLFKLRDYLHTNFVGFLTDHKSKVMFRNIDHTHSMKFFKLQLTNTHFLDYYSLPGNNPNSSTIVLAEGIFDIYTEWIYDYTNNKKDAKIYASVLSSKYEELIKSIVHDYQLFRVDVVILSDNGINLEYYEKMKFFNSHIINSLTVYYNKTGKDWNTTPVTPDKNII